MLKFTLSLDLLYLLSYIFFLNANLIFYYYDELCTALLGHSYILLCCRMNIGNSTTAITSTIRNSNFLIVCPAELCQFLDKHLVLLLLHFYLMKVHLQCNNYNNTILTTYIFSPSILFNFSILQLSFYSVLYTSVYRTETVLLVFDRWRKPSISRTYYLCYSCMISSNP